LVDTQLSEYLRRRGSNTEDQLSIMSGSWSSSLIHDVRKIEQIVHALREVTKMSTMMDEWMKEHDDHRRV